MEEIKTTLESIESDLAFDRSKIDEILNAVRALEARVEAIEKRMPRTENKVHDAVQKVLQPIADEVLQAKTRKAKQSFFLKFLKGGVKHG